LPYDDYRNTKLASEVKRRLRRGNPDFFAALQKLLDLKGFSSDIAFDPLRPHKGLLAVIAGIISNLRSLQCAWKTATAVPPCVAHLVLVRADFRFLRTICD
jgi:hypothetical protein